MKSFWYYFIKIINNFWGSVIIGMFNFVVLKEMFIFFLVSYKSVDCVFSCGN